MRVTDIGAFISQEHDGSERVNTYAGCVGQPCAMLQHNKERDACQGICNQALLPLSVWETIHFQNRPQCAEVATELQITRGSSGQVAGVVSPVPQQD